MIFERPILAIDIGSYAIKIVDLHGGKDKKLKSIGFAQLPRGAIVDGQIKDEKVVKQTLRDLIKKKGISTKFRRVALSVSGTSVIVKRVLIAPNKDMTIADQTALEAEQIFHVDINDLDWDFFEMRGFNAYDEKVPVLMVGARHEVIEKYIEVIRACDLRIGVIDCDCLALSNMFSFNYGYSNQLVGLVNIGASKAQMTLLWNGEFLFNRDSNIAGDELTKRIAEQMNIDLKNAETMKISALTNKMPEKVENIIREANEQLASEISAAIEFFTSSEDCPGLAKRISHIFLAGGGSKTIGLDTSFSQILQVPVSFVNPFEAVRVKVNAADKELIATSRQVFGISLGLALRQSQDKQAAA